MSKQIINLGSGVGAHDGDGARTGGRKINDNFTEVYDTIDILIADSSIYNKIITETGFLLSGQDLTVNAGWEWILGNIHKTNAAAVEVPIPFSAAGKSRIEYVVPNDSNGFTRIIGVESTDIPVAPSIPNKDMYVTWYTVDDGSISEMVAPITGDIYIPKAEMAPLSSLQSGVINFVILNSIHNRIDLNGGATELRSISSTSNPYLFPGRDLYLYNGGTGNCLVKHLFSTAGNYMFSFPDELDFIHKPKELIHFKLKFTTTGHGVYESVGRINSVVAVAVADVVGLPEALDLKLNTADYNQYFKGKYTTSATLISAIPTATDGDYAIVDTGTGVDAKEWIWDMEAGWIVSAATSASTTDALTEGSTNLYFTTARVLATVLTGISFITGGEIVSTDSVLTAFGKIQKQITDALTAISGKQNTLVAGTNIVIDNTNPLAPVISATGGSSILPVMEIATATTIADSDNGKVIIVTASCTVTVPNGLIAGFECSFVTLAGVTLTISLGGSVVLFNNTGTTMAEKMSFTLKNRTATNNYITSGNL